MCPKNEFSYFVFVKPVEFCDLRVSPLVKNPDTRGIFHNKLEKKKEFLCKDRGILRFKRVSPLVKNPDIKGIFYKTF